MKVPSNWEGERVRELLELPGPGAQAAVHLDSILPILSAHLDFPQSVGREQTCTHLQGPSLQPGMSRDNLCPIPQLSAIHPSHCPVISAKCSLPDLFLKMPLCRTQWPEVGSSGSPAIKSWAQKNPPAMSLRHQHRPQQPVCDARGQGRLMGTAAQR